MPSTPRWEDVAVDLTVASDPKTLGWTDTVLQISGSQDWNKVHLDPDYAAESGHGAIFYNTGWTAAMLSRVVTDWIGAGWVRRFEFQMRKMVSPGDTVTARAKVVGKRIDDDGTRLVDLDVWLETDRLGVTTTGTAQVSLPA